MRFASQDQLSGVEGSPVSFGASGLDPSGLGASFGGASLGGALSGFLFTVSFTGSLTGSAFALSGGGGRRPLARSFLLFPFRFLLLANSRSRSRLGIEPPFISRKEQSAESIA